MRTKILTSVVLGMALAGSLLLASCSGPGGEKVAAGTTKVSRAAETATVTTTFAVKGMMCTGCEAAIKGSVKKVPGVAKAEASYKKGEATVAYDPKKVSKEEIEKAIEKAGYQVAGEEAAAGDTATNPGTKERP